MAPPLPIRTALWLWLIAALAAGRLLLLQRIPMPAVQGILFGLTALLGVAYLASHAVRIWADGLPLRTLVLLHVTRFVGFYFIYLYRQDRLPYAFAVPGGLGDILVAALALVVALVPLATATRLRAIFIWNVIGLVDILMVVVTAARLGVGHPSSMSELTHLPLSLLPTFLVPLIIVTHVFLFVRLRRAMGSA